MRRLPLPFLVAAAFALPSAVEAQDFRATVTGQLTAASRPVTSNGFRNDPSVLSRDIVVGMLANGTTSMVELTLEGGAMYFIAAACDEDCEDMDLRIFAPGKTTVLAEDTKDDDYPMINFAAPSSGRYMLAVNMAKCKEAMCYYGYQVFKK